MPPSFGPPPRRLLLKLGVDGVAGLLLGLRLPSLARATDLAGDLAPNAFVGVDPAGAVTVIAPHTELGQGI